eukprot:9960030-Ditylum_brightwellii.AAC.1
MLYVFVVLGVVAVYSCLLDSETPKHHLFYTFGSSLPNCSVRTSCQWQWQQQQCQGYMYLLNYPQQIK